MLLPPLLSIWLTGYLFFDRANSSAWDTRETLAHYVQKTTVNRALCISGTGKAILQSTEEEKKKP